MKAQNCADTDGLLKASGWFLPGLRLALLCCRRFTGFDWLGKFRRNRGILHHIENAKNYNFHNTTMSLNVSRNIDVEAFLAQPAGWSGRECVKPSKSARFS